MLFVMYCLDKPDSLELRMANREDHLKYVGSLSIDIQIAGPVFDETGEQMCGSLFIIEANSIEEVRAAGLNDPYQKAGLFSSVDIRPFRKVVGN